MATFVAKNPRVISAATASVNVSLGQAGDFIFDYQLLILWVIGQNTAGAKTLSQVSASAPVAPGTLSLSVTNTGLVPIALGEYVDHNTIATVQRAGAIPFGPVSGVALSAAAVGVGLTIAVAGYAKVLCGGAFGPRTLLTVDANGQAVAASSLTAPTPPAIQGGETHAYSLIPGIPGQLCDVILCLNGTRPGAFA